MGATTHPARRPGAGWGHLRHDVVGPRAGKGLARREGPPAAFPSSTSQALSAALFKRTDVPNDHGPVGAARSQTLPVGAERQVNHGSGVTAKGKPWEGVVQVPEDHAAV